MRVYVLDTETTGFVEPVPMSLAYLPLMGEPGAFELGEGEKFMFNPGKNPEFGALATHHILPTDVDGEPAWDPNRVPPMDYMVGHSIDYDWEVVGSPKTKRICTFALARWLWPDLDSHKLTALVYFTHGMTRKTRDSLAQAHDALADVYSATSLLQAMIEHMRVADPKEYGLQGDTFGVEEMTWEDLWGWSELARIPTTLGFGKNKGVRIESIDFHDPGYKSYMLRQPNLDPYVKQAFETIPQIRSCGCPQHTK